LAPCWLTCAGAPRSVEKRLTTSEGKVSAENILAAVATVLVLIYLFYSLLRPEKF
jgi:K+-transporting ATPase KdpF subunit